jgi:predicted transglutaminase-like cysteine proteinase
VGGGVAVCAPSCRTCVTRLKLAHAMLLLHKSFPIFYLNMTCTQRAAKKILPYLIGGFVTVASLLMPGCNGQPVEPVIPNPVTEYADNLGFSADYKSILEPLGKDGLLGYNDKELIDELNRLPNAMQYDTKVKSLVEKTTEDGEVTNDELNRFLDLDGDGVSNKVESTIYQTNPSIVERWDDFDTVTSMLNTPEKVSDYLKNSIRYESDALTYGKGNYWASALELFNKKRGDCEDITTFGVYSLLKSGNYKLDNFDIYATNAVSGIGAARIQNGHSGGHAVILYKIDNLFYYIDTDPKRMGMIKGPFDTIEKVADEVYPSWNDYRLFGDKPGSFLKTVKKKR